MTLLRVFSYRRFPRELEGRRRMGVEKHPSSPCFAHPVLLPPPKPVGRARPSCLLLLFPTKLTLPILLPALICCEETHRSPHHMLSTLLRFLPQCNGFCSKPVIAHCGASWAHRQLPRAPRPTAPSLFPAARSDLLSALLSHAA